MLSMIIVKLVTSCLLFTLKSIPTGYEWFQFSNVNFSCVDSVATYEEQHTMQWSNNLRNFVGGPRSISPMSHVYTYQNSKKK